MLDFPRFLCCLHPEKLDSPGYLCWLHLKMLKFPGERKPLPVRNFTIRNLFFDIICPDNLVSKCRQNTIFPDCHFNRRHSTTSRTLLKRVQGGAALKWLWLEQGTMNSALSTTPSRTSDLPTLQMALPQHLPSPPCSVPRLHCLAGA